MGSSSQTDVNDFAGILFDGLESVAITLGAQSIGNDTLDITGIADDTPTSIDTGPGADVINIGPDLSLIRAALTINGGQAMNDRIIVNSDTLSDLTLDTADGGDRGMITGTTGLASSGKIEWEQVQLLTINQSAGDDRLTVVDTAAQLVVNTGLGRDRVKVINTSDAVMIDLGGGDDGESGTCSEPDFCLGLTIENMGAALALDGGGDPLDRLIVDQTSATAAITTGTLTDDPIHDDTGQIRGVVSDDINFTGLARIDVALGTGNDVFVVDSGQHDHLLNTTVAISGGGGDDQMVVESLGGPETIVVGDGDQDEVITLIDTAPIADQFSRLSLMAEKLTIDNRGNSGPGAEPVEWTLRSTGELTATISSGTVPVINTMGADMTNVLGGSEADTLNVVSEANTDIQGSIDGNRVQLRTGLKVLQPAGFGSFVDYESVISFDGLAPVTSSYEEDGFRLSGNLIRDDSVSPAVSANGTLTLQTISGEPFSIYSLTLSASVDGPQLPITFVGTTLQQATVTVTPTMTVDRKTGFQTFAFPDTFGLLTKVEWNAGKTLVDNVVVAASTTVGGAPVNIASVPGFMPGFRRDITFNTDVADGTTGSLNGTPYTVYRPGGSEITTFAFAGDLNISANSSVRAIGSRGLSVQVANDVNIQDGVQFDVSAISTSRGAGGGSGGGGTIGGDGGAGSRGGLGALTVGGGGSGGTGFFDGNGGSGGHGNNGSLSSVGGNGSVGNVGGRGSAGINNSDVGGSGGGAGAAGSGAVTNLLVNVSGIPIPFLFPTTRADVPQSVVGFPVIAALGALNGIGGEGGNGGKWEPFNGAGGSGGGSGGGGGGGTGGGGGGAGGGGGGSINQAWGGDGGLGMQAAAVLVAVPEAPAETVVPGEPAAKAAGEPAVPSSWSVPMSTPAPQPSMRLAVAAFEVAQTDDSFLGPIRRSLPPDPAVIPVVQARDGDRRASSSTPLNCSLKACEPTIRTCPIRSVSVIKTRLTSPGLSAAQNCLDFYPNPSRSDRSPKPYKTSSAKMHPMVHWPQWYASMWGQRVFPMTMAAMTWSFLLTSPRLLWRTPSWEPSHRRPVSNSRLT